MEVQVVSRETIKPSSPTPDHLRVRKLSFLDQIFSNSFSTVLFYPTINRHRSEISRTLKSSLAETLTQFYSFSGTWRSGSLQVNCDDYGVSYAEANVGCDMRMVLQNPNTHQLEKLLPKDPSEKTLQNPTIQELVAVQVNHFSGDGFALGVRVDHVVADASSLAIFLKTWAAISRGGNVIENLIFDCTSLFPSVEGLNLSPTPLGNGFFHEIVTKRFLFNGSKIAALRGRTGNGPYLECPTRYEIVSTLIWSASMRAVRERNKNISNFVVVNVVDLRRRIKSPFDGHFIGNFCQMTKASCSTEDVCNYNYLASKIHESVKKMNDEWYDTDKTLDLFKIIGKQFDGQSNIRMFSFSSWCRIPFYETDFGLGKPLWIGTAPKFENVMGSILLDSCDGEGIEAWVGLPKEEMILFEQNC